MQNTPQAWTFQPIGHIQSCYGEKFAVPRQPNLVSAATAIIQLRGDANNPHAVQGLDEFSHLWVCFVFDQTASQWQPLIRPPRLGGNAKVGVFASRSNFRPNPIGWSVVELDKVETGNSVRLHVRGGDFVNGTPVLDIKPYIPYADAHPNATASYAQQPPQASLNVEFSAAALEYLQGKSELKELIQQTLAFDVRPAYQKDPTREYGAILSGVNVRWTVQEQQLTVQSALPANEQSS